MNDIAGKVIILNEIKRARTLAASMLGAKAKFSFEDIIGLNHEFLETLRQAKLASQNKSNVLLLGDSGTGKDILHRPFIITAAAGMVRMLLLTVPPFPGI